MLALIILQALGGFLGAGDSPMVDPAGLPTTLCLVVLVVPLIMGPVVWSLEKFNEQIHMKNISKQYGAASPWAKANDETHHSLPQAEEARLRALELENEVRHVKSSTARKGQVEDGDELGEDQDIELVDVTPGDVETGGRHDRASHEHAHGKHHHNEGHGHGDVHNHDRSGGEHGHITHKHSHKDKHKDNDKHKHKHKHKHTHKHKKHGEKGQHNDEHESDDDGF